MSRSYLNVLDFPSAELLAQEMVRLAGNESAYLEYFWWKVVARMMVMMVIMMINTVIFFMIISMTINVVTQEHYDVHDMPEGREQAMCQLCDNLHQVVVAGIMMSAV